MSQASQINEFPVIVIVDDNETRHWILEQGEMILGRDDDCDIVIAHRQISRQHIRFYRDDEGIYMLEDLNSKNGTWLNGNRVAGSRQLSDGDEIRVTPHVRLRYVGSGITAPITQTLPDVISTAAFKGRLKVDVEARRVFILGEEMEPPLSLPQYRLLELLYLNSSRVCTREEVVETVWPEAEGEGVSEQAIDALVRRLRDRLTEADPEWQYVVTVRGHGFRLDNPVGDD